MIGDSFKQSCTSDVSFIESHVHALTYLISFLVEIIIFDCFCADLLLLDIATFKKSCKSSDKLQLIVPLFYCKNLFVNMLSIKVDKVLVTRVG